MSASYPTKLLLAFRSGDTCAFPDCRKSLTIDGKISDDTIIGEAAHIAGERPGAARYDATMSDDQRDHYDNLIYLCSACHTRIDKQIEDFSVDQLNEMKKNHERKVRDAMNEAFATVSFLELQRATEWIKSIAPSCASDFSLITVQDKISKNGLGLDVNVTIAMGLSVSKEIEQFVEAEIKVDNAFPEKLTAGFLEEYYRLKHRGCRGSELFDLMCAFAQRGFDSQAQKSAALAVLIYLFERCEVFEK